MRRDAGRSFDRFVERGGIAIDGKDLRAFLDEAHGRRAAIAPAGPDAARAGDDRDLAFKPRSHRNAADCRRAGAAGAAFAAAP